MRVWEGIEKRNLIRQIIKIAIFRGPGEEVRKGLYCSGIFLKPVFEAKFVFSRLLYPSKRFPEFIEREPKATGHLR